MSAFHMLRRNNPDTTDIRIRLHEERSDAVLAGALEQNLFVRELLLDFRGEERANWNSLLRVIARHPNLEKVVLQDSYRAERRNALAELVRSTLQVIQQNTAIQSVEMHWLCLPTDISMFLDNASAITEFCLYYCYMEPAERQQGAISLAVALQRNTNIQSLKIYKMDNIYAVPILEGLQSNTSVKAFTFGLENFTDVASRGLHRLLDSSTSIQKLVLKGTYFGEETFRPIAQSLIQSQIVCKLKLMNCRFSSDAQFQSVLQNKQNLTSLCLHECYFFGGQVHGDIISLLLQPDSLLHCFEFQSRRASFQTVESVFPRIPFEALLQAIKKSKLERFTIGTFQSQHQMQSLTQSIPNMKLKELVIQYEWHDYDRSRSAKKELLQAVKNAKEELLQAVKNNFTLLSVKCETSYGVDLFNQRDKQRLAFYANRNKNLDRWVDNPETVEQQKVWPHALGLAERAGPNALFQGLRLVLGSDCVHLPGGRKRKRTQYYSPS